MIGWFLEYAYLAVYAVTLGVALWRYPRYFDTVFKYFPILLMYTFITELAGNIIKAYNEYDLVLTDLLDYNNWVIYNIYDIIFFLYFFYVFHSTIKNESYKKKILIGAIIYSITAVINPFIADFMSQFQMISYVVGALVLLMSIVMYYSYLKSVTGHWFIQSNLLCWLSLGMLIFFAGYLPVIFLGHSELVSRENYWILRRLHLLLIPAMYTCFTIGFIKMSRRSFI